MPSSEIQLLKYNYKHVVSLGVHCQPAHQIRRILNIESAHVFDWLITPHGGLKLLLQSRFKEFFERSRLTRSPENRVVDSLTGLQFFHDFEEAEDIDLTYQEKYAKYQELVFRFLSLLNGLEPILFVRQQSVCVTNCRARAKDLASTISEVAPQLPFSLLYITRDSEVTISSHDEKQIVCATIPELSGAGWTGNDLAWEKIMTKLVTDEHIRL